MTAGTGRREPQHPQHLFAAQCSCFQHYTLPSALTSEHDTPDTTHSRGLPVGSRRSAASVRHLHRHCAADGTEARTRSGRWSPLPLLLLHRRPWAGPERTTERHRRSSCWADASWCRYRSSQCALAVLVSHWLDVTFQQQLLYLLAVWVLCIPDTYRRISVHKQQSSATPTTEVSRSSGKADVSRIE